MYYLLLFGIAVQIIACIYYGETILKTLFYAALNFLLVYAFLLRHACKIEIDALTFKVKYAFPWDRDITLNLSNMESLDYKKGFYDLFSSKSLGGIFVFPKYCYDQLIFEMKKTDDIVYIEINTRMFAFDKTVLLLKKLISS